MLRTGSEGRSFVGDCRSAERHGSPRRLCAVGAGFGYEGSGSCVGPARGAWEASAPREGLFGTGEKCAFRFPPHATGEECTANMYRYYPVLAGRAPRRPAGVDWYDPKSKPRR